MNSRTVIVGEAPGRRDTGTTPLFGMFAAGSAGSRLRTICDLNHAQWRDVRRVNLQPVLKPWDATEMRTTASSWMHALLRRHRVICCGKRVATAFQIADLPMCTYRVHEGGAAGPTQLAWIPHPSGRSLFYNDPNNRELVGAFLRRALGITKD